MPAGHGRGSRMHDGIAAIAWQNACLRGLIVQFCELR